MKSERLVKKVRKREVDGGRSRGRLRTSCKDNGGLQWEKAVEMTEGMDEVEFLLLWPSGVACMWR